MPPPNRRGTSHMLLHARGQQRQHLRRHAAIPPRVMAMKQVRGPRRRKTIPAPTPAKYADMSISSELIYDKNFFRLRTTNNGLIFFFRVSSASCRMSAPSAPQTVFTCCLRSLSIHHRLPRPTTLRVWVFLLFWLGAMDWHLILDRVECVHFPRVATISDAY